VDVVNRIVPQIISGREIEKPGLGVMIAEDPIVRRLGLEGVLIVGVTPGSGAEKAGLRPTERDARGRLILGDLIVGADGKPVRNTNDLFRILDNQKVGDTIRLTILRDERKVEVDVTLQTLS